MDRGKIFNKIFFRQRDATDNSYRTDNGSCFKCEDFKEFCDAKNIKRILSTPNLHTGMGLVERTVRTIKALTRANSEANLSYEGSVQLALK